MKLSEQQVSFITSIRYIINCISTGMSLKKKKKKKNNIDYYKIGKGNTKTFPFLINKFQNANPIANPARVLKPEIAVSLKESVPESTFTLALE